MIIKENIKQYTYVNERNKLYTIAQLKKESE